MQERCEVNLKVYGCTWGLKHRRRKPQTVKQILRKHWHENAKVLEQEPRSFPKINAGQNCVVAWNRVTEMCDLNVINSRW